MTKLERYNNDLQQLLGNSDRLEPLRRKRNAAVPALFEHFRKQALSLHQSICRSSQCDCSSVHSSKLMLPETDLYSSFEGSASTTSLKLKVYFPRKFGAWSSSHTLVGPDDDWYVADIEMAGLDNNTIPPPLPSNNAAASLKTVLVGGTKDAVQGSSKITRKVSIQPHTRRRLSSGSIVPKDALEIRDLCAALKEYDVMKATSWVFAWR